MLIGDGGLGCLAGYLLLALQTAPQFRLMKLREMFEVVDRDGESLPTVRTCREHAGCSSYGMLHADRQGILKFQNKWVLSDHAKNSHHVLTGLANH